MQSFGRTGKLFLLMSLVDAAVLVVGLAIDVDAVVVVGAILLATSLLLAMVFGLVQRRLFGSPRALRRINLEGMPANATVTAVGPTAGAVGANPIMKLELNVNLQSVTVRTVAPAHKVHRVQVGATLPVKVHPDHPLLAVVDWDSVP